MWRSLCLFPVVLAACATGPQVAYDGRSAERAIEDITPGMLVISEVMIDPVECADLQGEWFEVTNLTDSWLQLEGITVTDADFYRSTLSRFELAPRSRAVVGQGPDREWCSETIVPAGFFEGDIALNNGGDAIHLYNHKTGILIDQTPIFPPEMVVPGSTVQLQPWGHEPTRNDDLANWYVSSECPYAPKDATPAAANPECDMNAPAPEPGWFGLICQGYSCDIPADFQTTQHLNEAWAEAEDPASFAENGGELFFEDISFDGHNVRAADWFTTDHEVGVTYNFYVPADDSEEDQWDAFVWVFVDENRTDVDTDSSLGSEPMTREQTLTMLGGIDFPAAIAQLAQTQPDFEIYWGDIRIPLGSTTPVLRLRDRVTEQDATWNAQTGERLN